MTKLDRGLAADLIDAPGLYDMPPGRYHADPVAGGSLSSHGARQLLACPAVFQYNRTHRVEKHTSEMDEGTAAHLAVLGAGQHVVVVDAEDWRTKDARDIRDQAYAKGRTPILAHKWEAIRGGQVAAIRQHPLASALLSGGQPEQVMIWRDEPTGVWCRAMADYLNPLWMVDYKTTDSADPDAIRKQVANLGYYIQQEHYRDGAQALGLGRLPFYFIFQERTPPFLVTVARLHPNFEVAGRNRNARAREMFRDCTAAGVWPPYAADNEIVTIDPPRWLTIEE